MSFAIGCSPNPSASRRDESSVRFSATRHTEKTRLRFGRGLSRERRRRRDRQTNCVTAAGKGFGSTDTDRHKTDAIGSEVTQLKDDAKRISGLLGGINLLFLGDNTELNAAVATAVAPLVGYTLLHTVLVIEKLKGQSMDEIGGDEIGLTEALVVENLSSHVRCVISTYGNGVGASARGDCWRFIFGAVSIWLDTEEETPADKVQNEAYSQCDVHLQIKNTEQEICWKDQAESFAMALLPDLFNALNATLSEEKDLCKKKSLYVRLGCRGDWPNIEVPDWAKK